VEAELKLKELSIGLFFFSFFVWMFLDVLMARTEHGATIDTERGQVLPPIFRNGQIFDPPISLDV